MASVDPDYILSPEKLHKYVVKRLFAEGIANEELQQQKVIKPYIGFLPGELETILSEHPELPAPADMLIEQQNGREPIYNHDGITRIPLAGESRMWRYLDMVRWTTDCVPHFPEIYGENAKIVFEPQYFGYSDTAAFRRFEELDWKLVNEVFSFKEQMGELKGIIFNSIGTVAATMIQKGVTAESIIKSEKRFSREYLAYQFIPVGNGYVLNFDYSFGSQVGSIIENISKIYNKRIKQDNWPSSKLELAICLLGKAGSIDPDVHKGSIVLPNSLITAAGETRQVDNELIELISGSIGPNFPQVSVINQRRSELELGRKAGAKIVEMEMMDAVDGIRYIQRWHDKTIKPHFLYGTVVSDKPLEGETIETEDVAQENRGYAKIVEAFKEYIESF